MTDATAAWSADNPFSSPSDLPFAAPDFDRIREEHFLPAFYVGMEQHRDEIRDIADADAAPTFENTVEALERVGQVLDRTARVFFNLTGSTTTDGLQAIQVEIAPKLAAHSDSIWLDAALFARVQQVYEDRDDLEPEARQLTERYHLSFVRHGARLPAAKQQRIREINERCSELTTRFQEHLLKETQALAVLADTEEELAGLGEGDVSAAADAAAAAGHADKYLLTIELPTSQGVLSSLSNRATRRRVFEASVSRCNRGNDYDTKMIALELSALRAEHAALLGYETHSHYVLADETAGTPDAVREMMASMTAAIVAKTRAEAEELQRHLDEHAPGTQLEPWDWAWTSEQVRRARFDFDEAEVKQYFEFERVLVDGMFFMAEQLYGVTMKERTDLPVYHEDVRVFEMFDEGGAAIALFYADYYARPSKRGGAWMSSFADQSALHDQRPVVVNVMNIKKPSSGPTLLSFDEVTTMFHEFGHGVHGMFSEVRFPMLSGTSVPRDYVEFPSQFHEDFAFDAAVLERCAKHYQTGAAMPEDLLAKVKRARTFGQGFAALEYIAAAWLDLAWHSLSASETVAAVEAFEIRALKDAGVHVPLVPPRYKSTYFAHIWPGGYSAGYYAYLWSEALAADGFAACEASGGMTRENGRRFRETVLSRGLTQPPMDQFRAFRGEALDTTAVLRRRGLIS
ncbi:MAG: peptidase M3 [Planctomycetes bacterium]|nr:peptidase M3 [Planctomycetota bacterium]